jgi:hypothetical protein
MKDFQKDSIKMISKVIVSKCGQKLRARDRKFCLKKKYID